jgi:hypothetical protein
MTETTPQLRAEWKYAAKYTTQPDGAWHLQERILALVADLEAVERDAAHLQDTVDHYIARAVEAESERNAEVGRLGNRLGEERARAEQAEAALEAGDACGAVGCRALAERDRLAAGIEALACDNDARFPHNKAAARYTGVGSNALRALLDGEESDV